MKYRPCVKYIHLDDADAAAGDDFGPTAGEQRLHNDVLSFPLGDRSRRFQETKLGLPGGKGTGNLCGTGRKKAQ